MNVILNIDIKNTLILVYCVSQVVSMYVMILNDLLNKRLTGEALLTCMLSSFLPVINVILLVYYGISNMVDAIKCCK
jgi:hypothetical protein